MKKEFRSIEKETLMNRATANNIEELTPLTGGTPIINVLLTDFCSGSTFTEEILNKIPASFYHYEPLFYYEGLTRVHDDEQGQHAVNDILKRLHCDFDGLQKYLHIAKADQYPLRNNTRVMNYFESASDYTLDFLSNACRLFPVQTMKITRLSLKYARSLLEDKSINLRLVFFIRDPRGVMNSRYNYWRFVKIFKHMLLTYYVRSCI